MTRRLTRKLHDCPQTNATTNATCEARQPAGGGPRVVVSTAAFHARARGSVPGLGGLKETKMFLPHPRVKLSIVGSLRDREVACSASDRQGSNFESCVWRTVISFISPSSGGSPGPVLPICGQRWPKDRFIPLRQLA